MGASVTLVCRGCGRRMPYFRRNDPSLPVWVETISMSACDLCHDGDRMSEDWLDADGNCPDPNDMEPDEPTRTPPTASQVPGSVHKSTPTLSGEGEP